MSDEPKPEPLASADGLPEGGGTAPSQESSASSDPQPEAAAPGSETAATREAAPQAEPPQAEPPLAEAAAPRGATPAAEPAPAEKLTRSKRAAAAREAAARAAAAAGHSADSAASAGAGYRVQLPGFDGPLDLLLHLIQQHELDILDIPIGFVAEKYVEYLSLMKDLNIDVASEYLVMAATLTHIKSKMLLPSVPDDDEDAAAEQEIDPRAELVRRLLEYQKYKHAAEELGGRNLFGRDVFGRGAPAPAAEGTAPLAPISLFKLIDAFQSVLDRAKIKVDHQIDLERFSITDRINELADILRERPRLRFEELFENQSTRIELIITFLALLEMTRLRMTRLFQTGPLEPIYVELAVTDEAETAAVTQAVAAALSDEPTPAAASSAEPPAEPAPPPASPGDPVQPDAVGSVGPNVNPVREEDVLGEDALGEDALGEDALGDDALGEDALGEDAPESAPPRPDPAELDDQPEAEQDFEGNDPDGDEETS